MRVRYPRVERPVVSLNSEWITRCPRMRRPQPARLTYAACMAFTRISIDHRIMGGLPCIAGTRIPVAMVVRMIAAGTPVETILEQYPQLVEEDVREALRFAAANLDQRVKPLDQSA